MKISESTEKMIIDFNNQIEKELSDSLKDKKVSPFQRSAAYQNLNKKVVAKFRLQVQEEMNLDYEDAKDEILKVIGEY
jgi:hypothetical protein